MGLPPIIEKTMSQESIEGAHRRSKQSYEKSRNFYISQPVADTKTKSAHNPLAHGNKEKFKGDFKLLINHKLPMHKKIERFGNEPVVFYLHKKRNFINKIEKSKI
jgi:hypothetical protein